MNKTFDQNSTIVELAIRNQGNLTAFSARPDSPVLPYAPRRRRLAGLARQVRALRRHGPQPAHRPVPARPAAS